MQDRRLSIIMLYKVSRQKMYIRFGTHSSLEEVFAAGASAGGHGAAVIRHGAEDLELGLQVFAEVHDGSDVAAAVAVVGGGPHGDDVFVFEVVLVAFVDELVGAGDELEAVDVVELGCVSWQDCAFMRFYEPLRKLCRRIASQHHGVTRPRCRLLPDHSIPNRRKHPRAESPGLAQRRESDLACESPGSIHREHIALYRLQWRLGQGNQKPGSTPSKRTRCRTWSGTPRRNRTPG